MGTSSDPDRVTGEPDGSISYHAPRTAGDSETADPLAALERAFIDEFLASRGCTVRSIVGLPPGDREPLLCAAATFATLKLAD